MGRRVVAALVAAAAVAVLVDRALHGVDMTRAALTGPVAAGPWWVVPAGATVLAATGAVPAWRMAGGRPLALFLAPCLGALVAAVSAVVTVVGASEPLRWYVAFAAAANAAALASVATRSDDRRRWPRLGTVLVGAAVMAAVGFGASVLGRGRPSPVAGATWVALARVLVHGHRAVVPALGPSASAARLLSSPLGAGTAAVTWLVTGASSAAAARGVLLVVAAAAVGAAACAVVEAGTVVPTRWSSSARLLAVLAAVAFCLAAFGVAGPQAAGGDLTLLWTSAVTGAAVLCLVLPPTGWRLRAGVTLAAVAVLAAPAGVVAVVAAIVAVGVRRTAGAPGRGRGALRLVDLVGALVALAAAGTWPVVAAVEGVGSPATGLPPPGGLARVADAWHALGPALWPAAVAAAVVAAVAGVAVGARRRLAGMAGDVGLLVVVLVTLAAQLAAAGWDTAVSLPLRLEPPALVASLAVLMATACVAVWLPLAFGAAGPPAAGETADRSAGGRAAAVEASDDRRALAETVPAPPSTVSALMPPS